LVEEFPLYWEDLENLRKFIIGESFITHIWVAAFTLGAGLIAPFMEMMGMIRKDQRYERFARGMTTINIVLYALGATLAVAAFFFTWGFYPTFWSILWWQFFWALIATEWVWWGQLYVLLLYYFLWDRLSGRAKPLHVLLGFMWLPMSGLQQAFLFPMVDFMMTPIAEHPYFNPSVIPQLSHRFMGNISWAGFAIAGFAGMQYLRYAGRNNQRQAAFWDWVGSLGIIFGVLFITFMATSGYSWVMAAKGNSPGVFHRMMVGPIAWMFQLQVFFIGMTVAVSTFYMWHRVKRAGRTTYGLKWIFLIVVAFWVLGSIPYYIGPGADDRWVEWTIPIGAMRPWKYIALTGIFGFGLVAVLAYLQAARDGLNWGASGQAAPRALITAGLLALCMMFTMGVIRETSKLPAFIYGQMNSEQQVIPPEIVPQEDVHRPRFGPFRSP
jgi:cytochrome bd ubiquinol oxidase subunit I